MIHGRWLDQCDASAIDQLVLVGKLCLMYGCLFDTSGVGLNIYEVLNFIQAGSICVYFDCMGS